MADDTSAHVIQTADSGYGDSEDGSLRRPVNSGNSSPTSGKPSVFSSHGYDEDEEPTTPDNVSVIIRVRPLNSKEIARNETSALQFPGEGRILVDSHQNGAKPKLFTFNVVFEPESTQEEIFEHSGIKHLIDMALDGFSSTAFAYGQTGSGKTFTLTGPPLVNGNLAPFDEMQGLMVRSFKYLFERLALKQDMTCILHASFLEIYNEQVVDLLNPGSQRKYLQVRWTRGKGFYVENLFIIECTELDDVLAVLEEGLRHRQVAPNNINENSSRSHCILTVNITSEIRVSEDDSTYITKHGKLTFVDLAGSEKVVGTPKRGGDNLQETNKINRSLLTLGKCISALGDQRKREGHIPYRDSKLTKLLADSLGGNGVTLMIACVNPSKYNVSESQNTLRYAARTKQIKNKPVIIMDPRETTILALRKEVKLLKAENQYLRQQLEFPKRPEKKMSAIMKSSSLENLEKLREAAERNGSLPPEVNPKELYDMLKEYMVENEALREETADLLRARDVLIHDQETVCRENERLTKKLEEKDSKFSRGTPNSDPLNNSARSMASSMSSTGTNIWVNDLDNTLSNSKSVPGLLPDSISRELHRRNIGTSLSDQTRPKNDTNKRHVRHNSWDGQPRTVNRSMATPPGGATSRKPMPVPAVRPSLSPKGSRAMAKSKSEQSLQNVESSQETNNNRAANKANNNRYGIRKSLQKATKEKEPPEVKKPLKRRMFGKKQSL